MALLDGGRVLCVANARSGGLSLIDVKSLRVTGEVDVGGRPSDVAALPDGRRLLVTDEKRHQLLAFQYEDGELHELARVTLSRYPVSLVVSADGARCCVASLWSRALSIIDLSALSDAGLSGKASHSKLRVFWTVRLPFPPREQLFLPGDDHLLVADAFAGALALIDVRTGKVEQSHTLPAHNIRGLALSADRRSVLVSHQFLNSLAATSQDHIHWGLLVTNAVRSLPVERLLDPKADLRGESQFIPLGGVGNGAADPSGVAALEGGGMVVALSGVGEIIIRPGDGSRATRVQVGRRPTAVLSAAGGSRVYVANTLSDSISVVDTREARVVREIALGAMPELSPRDRGERMFYNAGLSHDRWLSCHSCHTDGHSTGQLADTLGDGSYGAPKRILSLLGTADAGPWGWNGSVKTLHDQIHNTVRNTMHGKPINDGQARDLVAFLHSLPSAPPIEPVASTPESRASRRRGDELFAKLGCRECHVPPLTYTTHGAFDVGLTDEKGNKKFNPPSLRGVSQRAGYFHDKRARTLEEVFTTHAHQLDRQLSEKELADLLRFLRGL